MRFIRGAIIEKAGCAFYHSNRDFSKKVRLPNEISIYSAELWAILEALEYCSEYNVNSCFIIFSDSKSALEAILNCKNIAFSNYIIMKILDTYHSLISKNIKISLVWIKAHIGIQGNEFVDKLAKEATNIEVIDNHIKIPFSDLVKKARENMFYKWQMQYTENPKGSFYKQLFPEVTKTCWFNYVSHRNFIRIISRLRTSPCSVP